jgi:peptidoglycan/xylan/chitin deacetylase (PgdA/CDA1 family)
MQTAKSYFYTSRWWMQFRYPSLVWNIKTSQKEVFLTFDDGPHPEITPWVLKQLSLYNAKATFFCVGNNAMKYPNVLQQIINDGHVVGNHTFNHENGWFTSNEKYYSSIKKFDNFYGTFLFRPPYGRITSRQIKRLKNRYKIVMWSVLSGDFDANLDVDFCIENTIKHTKKGSILVFHDSEKSKEKLYKILPEILQKLSDKGFTFISIPNHL